MDKRGQITLFVIIAIVIVALVVGYFILKGQVRIEGIPPSLEPVYEYFLSCIETEIQIGTEILGERGGYIFLPDFEPGSEYMPTSSQLNFLGQPIPYWYYVSGNNVIREQVPSKREMESQLAKFIEERIPECDFSDFQKKGFFISIENSRIDVDIKDTKIDVSLDTLMTISKGQDSVQIKRLDTTASSKLGKFYSTALEIYDKEKKDVFLENYAVDVLRLYVPVDDVELTCSPKIWLKQDIEKELKEALEGNMQAIRFKSGRGKDYFTQNLNVDENVNLLYSRNWPTKIEAEPEEQSILIAEPVGLQPGLGVLGFCYVPYHFVYDLTYPVLIQVYNSDFLFQFPVAVIIEKNKPRESLPINSLREEEVELCKYKNQKVSVYTYDTDLKPVEADISFKCLTDKCDVGKTEMKEGDAILTALFPQCVNGFVLAKAEGYETAKLQISTNEENWASVILDKLYDLDLNLKVDGKETSNQGVIYFESEDVEKSRTVVWPQVKSFELSEGFYNISVYVYSDSDIKIPASTTTKCIDVPKSGLFGFFGATEERCFDIDFPEQTLSSGIIGGGKSVYYVTESELEEGKLEINAAKLPVPTSLEQLQENYNLLEHKKVNLMFG